jgi:hypothetical protein
MTRWVGGSCLAALLSAAVLIGPTVSASAALATGTGGRGAAPAVTGVRCVANNAAHAALAARMKRDIAGRLSGRVSSVGLAERDSRTGVTCTYNAAMHFYAASAIKVTILAALLRRAQEQHRQLTATEKSLAWRMITESDNDAATALWDEVGISGMQHFLDLARMRQTRLSYAWGLTLLTAHDEMLLLHLLSTKNRILHKASRVYERYLMAHVISSQRWGVPAGAPRSVVVHVKNGWLPYPGSTWEINSLGIFTATDRVYTISMLTYNNPSMGYGIFTIENVAEIIHHDLNPGAASVIPKSTPNPTWGVPDGSIPRTGE